jgi:hypothetical protein
MFSYYTLPTLLGEEPRFLYPLKSLLPFQEYIYPLARFSCSSSSSHAAPDPAWAHLVPRGDVLNAFLELIVLKPRMAVAMDRLGGSSDEPRRGGT